MKITLSNSLLNLIDMKSNQYVPEYNKPYFNLESGMEHYRLLVHLGHCYNNVEIFDIGTNRGASALSLAQNKNVFVNSLDIENVRENSNLDAVENIYFMLGNFQSDVGIQQKILKSPFVFFDIDHEYTNEIWLYNFLVDFGWRGLMICDDIHLNDKMKRFWKEVTVPKIDLTKYGHASGTGAILFGDDVEIDLQ